MMKTCTFENDINQDQDPVLTIKVFMIVFGLMVFVFGMGVGSVIFAPTLEMKQIAALFCFSIIWLVGGVFGVLWNVHSREVGVHEPISHLENAWYFRPFHLIVILTSGWLSGCTYFKYVRIEH